MNKNWSASKIEWLQKKKYHLEVVTLLKGNIQKELWIKMFGGLNHIWNQVKSANQS